MVSLTDSQITSITNWFNKELNQLGNEQLPTTCPTGTFNDINTSCSTSLSYSGSSGSEDSGCTVDYSANVTSIENAFAVNLDGTLKITTVSQNTTVATYNFLFNVPYYEDPKVEGTASSTTKIYVPGATYSYPCSTDSSQICFATNYIKVSSFQAPATYTGTTTNSTITGSIKFDVSYQKPSSSLPIKNVDLPNTDQNFYMTNISISNLTLVYDSIAGTIDIDNTGSIPITFSSNQVETFVSILFPAFENELNAQINTKIWYFNNN